MKEQLLSLRNLDLGHIDSAVYWGLTWEGQFSEKEENETDVPGDTYRRDYELQGKKREKSSNCLDF